MAAKKSKPLSTTLVTFLLDRSGSMASIKDATIEGFNAYLGGLKAEKKANIEFTFLQFDANMGSAQIDKIYVAEPVGEVAELTPSTFVPRGGTPLIEAAFKTISATEIALKKREDKPKVVVCIQTDGEENQSSHEFSWASLNDLIQKKTKAGWQFNFMGAGIDAYNQGAKMGISVANTMSYDSSNLQATRSAFASNSANSRLFASGVSMNTSYTAAQKLASGDKFDPILNKLQSSSVSTVKADLDLTETP